ncbi:MAG: glutathione S-transferase family protein [Asticcacaulis sp.]|uniref:glutathione S-transferase family protein n=1 Tax=Asticcacaulis sp. TaxID=1872648 RepID=UPI0039E224DA
MPVIEIFTKPGCGWAERNFAALELKGQPYHIVPSCTQAGVKTEEFLSLSPYARTPTVRIDGFVVYESAVINDYLDDILPQSPLRPADAKQRIANRLWIRHCDRELIPQLNAFAPGKEADKREAGRAAMTTALEQLAYWGLLNRPSAFWDGEEIGLVDLAYQTFFVALSKVNAQWDAGIELPEPVRQWAERIEAHTAVQRAREVGQQVTYIDAKGAA